MESAVWLRVVSALGVCVAIGTGLSGCNLESSSGSSGNAQIAGNAVSPAQQTSVTVSWLPPEQNVGGTVLTNLAGYHIHYGNSPSALTQEIDIPTPGLTDYVIQDLTPAMTYYFAVTSYNSAGVESDYSPVVKMHT